MSSVPPRFSIAGPVALVLGARVDPSGAPTLPLAARLETAVGLYADDRVAHLLLSGAAGQRPGFDDEVGAMLAWALAAGVPPSALIVDDAAFRTLDSMRRARRVFGLSAVTVVTNPFHLPRALFLARACGLAADGVAADEQRLPRPRKRVLRLAREGAAWARAVADVARLPDDAGRLRWAWRGPPPGDRRS